MKNVPPKISLLEKKTISKIRRCLHVWRNRMETQFRFVANWFFRAFMCKILISIKLTLSLHFNLSMGPQNVENIGLVAIFPIFLPNTLLSWMSVITGKLCLLDFQNIRSDPLSHWNIARWVCTVWEIGGYQQGWIKPKHFVWREKSLEMFEGGAGWSSGFTAYLQIRMIWVNSSSMSHLAQWIVSLETTPEGIWVGVLVGSGRKKTTYYENWNFPFYVFVYLRSAV